MKTAKEWDKEMPQEPEPFERGKQAYDDFDAANLAFIRAIQADALEAAALECDETNPAVFAAGERIRKLKEQP